MYPLSISFFFRYINPLHLGPSGRTKQPVNVASMGKPNSFSSIVRAALPRNLIRIHEIHRTQAKGAGWNIRIKRLHSDGHVVSFWWNFRRGKLDTYLGFAYNKMFGNSANTILPKWYWTMVMNPHGIPIHKNHLIQIQKIQIRKDNNPTNGLPPEFVFPPSIFFFCPRQFRGCLKKNWFWTHWIVFLNIAKFTRNMNHPFNCIHIHK